MNFLLQIVEEKKKYWNVISTLTHEPTDDENSMQLLPTDPTNSGHSMNRVSAEMVANDGEDVVIGCDYPLRMD